MASVENPPARAPSQLDSVVTLTQNAEPEQSPQSEAKKGKSRAFYLSFLAIMVTTFLSALDLTAVGTALPTIANALHDTKGEFTWVGSAYALSSTGFIPLSGSLSDAFGRRPVVLISIGFFAVGSALAGAAQNMNMMIAARTVQGIGGGGILALSEILVADLVPLAERGIYQGLLGLVWSFASSIGPPIGGALANRGNKAWRWLFYLNLPMTGISFVLVWFFLSVRQPEGSTRSKLAKVDWLGNAIVLAGSGLVIVGLAWGGIRFAWDSAETLAPLIIGFALLFVFAIYEAKVPKHPTVPFDIISNRTSLSGILATAVHGIVSISIIYYLPVFFQAGFGATPIRSAVDFLPAALLTAPMAFVGGVVITVMKKYRPTNWAGWCLMIAGMGILSLLREDSSTGLWVGVQIVAALGMGILFAGPVFPILAPLPNHRTASALALFTFTRAFFQAWGITIASTVLQNELKRKLPAAFVAQFPAGFELAYVAIPVIRNLGRTGEAADLALRKQVQHAFAMSMRTIWLVMTGIAGLGLLASFLMREIPMDTTVDERYALKEDERKTVADAEKQQSTSA
ncbi:MFS domain-containing protein [Mycena kentingensis (nom. inval.)]|nr:MFS domain-containing protein [Mycena kentingensis (nom. inval.)]